MDLPVHISGQGPAAVIQGPGWGPSSDYLRLTLAPLLPHWQVLTYDVRNTGRAPRVPAPGSQSALNLSDDLEAVREGQSIERFVLLGHSHGALVAMAYAIRFPARVRALVLIAPGLTEPGTWATEPELLSVYEADPDRADAVALLRSGRPRPEAFDSDRDLARWMRRRMPVNFYDLEALRRFQRQLVGVPAPALAAFRGTPDDGDEWVGERLAEVEAPTLVLVGSHDVTTPPSESERIAARLPRSEVVVLDRAGHNPWVERPDAFAAAVDAFRDGLSTRS